MAKDPSRRRKKARLDEALRELPAGRPGLPAVDSIRDVVSFVSPQQKEYRILKTTEQDAYDKPAQAKPPRRRRKD
jgi:hypothetical protein